VLKEEHSKEVAQLKEDHEKELQSLAERYSQDIAALEGHMTAETTQHEVYCECCSVTCYPVFLFYCILHSASTRVPIRSLFPGTVPFFIQMTRVNFKSPAFSKYPY
jgi:hypothetical protein